MAAPPAGRLEARNGPSSLRMPDEFSRAVAARLPPAFPREPNAAAEAVLAVLSERVAAGSSRKLAGLMPEPLRAMWPEAVMSGG